MTHTSFRLSGLLLVAALAAGCADNRSSIFITGRAAPTDVTKCTYSATGDKIYGPGLLDIGYTNYLTYDLMLYVQNELADPSGVGADNTSSSMAWTAETARLRVNPSDYITNQQLPASSLVPVRDLTDVVALDGTRYAPGGKAAQFVEALSSANGLQVNYAATADTVMPSGVTKRIILGITLSGHTLDGAKLETAEWYYPVDVCLGCLGGAGSLCSVYEPTECAAAVGQETYPICVVP